MRHSLPRTPNLPLSNFKVLFLSFRNAAETLFIQVNGDQVQRTVAAFLLALTVLAFSAMEIAIVGRSVAVERDW